MRLIKNLSRRSSDDRGAVAILFALLLVVLVGFGAFAVDMGYAYAVKRQLSVTADSAALAGAQEAGAKYKTLGGCGSALNAAVRSAARANYAAKVPQGAPATLPDSQISVTCTTNDVQVRVQTRSSLDSLLGGVFGTATLQPGAEATADVFGARAHSGLRPFTICIQTALAADSHVGTTYQSRYGHHNAAPVDCNPTGAGGNWGYAGFDIGQSNTLLKCLIEFGYSPQCGGNPEGVDLGAPSAPVNSSGDNGNNLSASYDTLMNKLMQEDAILLPVADKWVADANGSNAAYPSMGAIPVKLCGWAMPKPNGTWDSGTKGSCWNQALYDTGKASWDKVSLVIQWQKVGNWVTSSVGQSDTATCDLGSATCVPALRLLK